MIVMAVLTRTIGGCIMGEDAWRKVRANLPKAWAVNGKAYPVTNVAAGRLGEIRLALEVPEEDLMAFYGQKYSKATVVETVAGEAPPLLKKKRGRPPKARPPEVVPAPAPVF
jgi:hypothetical protein